MPGDEEDADDLAALEVLDEVREASSRRPGVLEDTNLQFEALPLSSGRLTSSFERFRK